MLGRAQSQQVLQIVAVHRQHQIEAAEVIELHLARAKVIEAYTTLRGRRARPPVRRIADMVGGGARRIDDNLETGFAQTVLEHTVSGGRAADIAKTDQQYAGGGLSFHGQIRLTEEFGAL
ncbi:hypothetical protein GCM10011348_33960 [Marinobacterium nitratireducens]|uniref:Uncharacterized protein n=1 Tax=Marinobacterium nitratireducens TaxID=518897 RepID=A0A918DVN4_9GAMM|nr:hypothetical protein GCM10011348_33960 [Marinobacterium nitratireducens]